MDQIPFALGLDDLACGTSAARFGQLLCAARPTPAHLPCDPSAASHHFTPSTLPDFASAVTHSASEPTLAHRICTTDGSNEPPTKRVRQSPLEAAFTGSLTAVGAPGLSADSFSTSLADASLSTPLPSERPSPSDLHSPASLSRPTHASFTLPTPSVRPKHTLPTASTTGGHSAQLKRSQQRETVKSHTRRCREKVNEKFERLLEALPAPPAGVEVKHKAQVLEHTIRVFRRLLARRAALRVDIALSSPHAVLHWAMGELSTRGAVAGGDSGAMVALLAAFGRLYATKKAWKYVEVWTSPSNRASKAVMPDADDAARQRLSAFAENVPAGASMVARAFAAARAEWLPEAHADPVAFTRAQAAKRAGLCVALAVPAVMRDGTCPAVLLVADTEPREYSTVEVAEVNEFVRIVADAYARHVVDARGSVEGHDAHARETETKEEAVECKTDAGRQDGFDIDAAFAIAASGAQQDPVLQTPALGELFSPGLGDLRVFQASELGGGHM